MVVPHQLGKITFRGSLGEVLAGEDSGMMFLSKEKLSAASGSRSELAGGVLPRRLWFAKLLWKIR